MKAVIMAGGEGTRLRPLTIGSPKPLLPIANVPMMQHVVNLLRGHGVDDIVVTVAYLANAIRTYFGDGSEFGVRMQYATEETPLGTAGSVRNAMAQLDERFVVISGDVLTDIDLGAVIRDHDRRGALATIALKSMENPIDFGIVITAPDGSIERFLEKPTWGEVFSDTINTGIYVLEPEIFDFIDEGVVDFSSDVFPKLLEAGKPLFGAITDGYWEDVGTLEAYVRAHGDVLDGRVATERSGFEISDGVWVGEGADIHPEARIDAPCVIGHDCRIDARARLAPHTVLGDNVRVGADAYLERAVIHDNSYVGPATRLRGCVVGRRGDLRRGARLEEGVVLGDECFVGEHAVVNPSVKVYPFKTVEPGAVVNSSIVWESRGARSLFGLDGVTGMANVDMSPELALRVALAYGTTLKKGATVTTSRDSSRIGRVLKRAVMVGLNAAGVNVDDLELATVPVTRFYARSGSSSGGITVRLAQDPEKVSLRFFDESGIDLDEGAQRKIERIYHREDFRRAVAAEIGDIGFAPRALEYYTAALIDTVDVDAISARGFKAVLDVSYGATSFVLPSVLAKLGADVLVVNPYAATSGATAFDRRSHAADVGALVRSSAADLGAVLSPDGERLTLVDDQGDILSGDQTMLAFVSLTTATTPTATVALPVDAPNAAAAAAEGNGASVIWTRRSPAHLLEEASSVKAALAVDRRGGVAVPGFLPAFDAVAALVHIMSDLAATGERLSEVRRQFGRPSIADEHVVTPWEHKGLVMRELVERYSDRELVLVDGVKIVHDDGWVLIVPDPEEPTTLVWAEAADDALARARAQEYARRIRQIIGSQPDAAR